MFKHRIVLIVKWIATISLCIAVYYRSIGDNNLYDIIFSAMGTALWIWVGLAWKDKAILLLNTILFFTLIIGLVNKINNLQLFL